MEIELAVFWILPSKSWVVIDTGKTLILFQMKLLKDFFGAALILLLISGTEC